MTKLLRAASLYLEHLAEKAIVCLFAVAFLATLYQVLSRYALKVGFLQELFPASVFSSIFFPWTEELVRYLFVWIVFLGIGVVYRRKGHVAMEAVTGFLPRKMQDLLSLAVVIVNGLFFLLLFFYGLQLLRTANGQLSPSLQLNMAWVYLAIPVGAFICFVHSLVFLAEGWSLLLAWRKGKEVPAGLAQPAQNENRAEAYRSAYGKEGTIR